MVQRAASWFCGVIFVALIGIGLVIGMYVALHADRLLTTAVRTAFFVGVPAATVLSGAFAFRLPMKWRAQAASILFAVGIGAYGAEFWLSTHQDPSKPPQGAWDSRTRFEVVRDLRAAGETAYPAVFPNYLLQTRIDGKTHSPFRFADGREYLPLGGVAGVRTVFCNEMADWVEFVADRYGFNNPDDVWDRRPIDVLALGDSFTQGTCVPVPNGFVDRIRASIPATVNLGMSGSGPLAELAALTEYGPALRPRRILWFMYPGNDLDDLAIEARSPLRSYLSDGAGRALMERREQVDQALRAYVDGLIAVSDARRNTDAGALQTFISFIGLSNVRRVFALPATNPPADYKLYAAVLKRAPGHRKPMERGILARLHSRYRVSHPKIRIRKMASAACRDAGANPRPGRLLGNRLY